MPTLLQSLTGEDTVVRYYTCEQLTSVQAHIPEVRAAVIRLLHDESDWDEFHVVGAAARALARTDPGGSWLPDACAAFRRFALSDRTSSAGRIARAVRAITTAKQFMEWCWGAFPDQAVAGDGLVATVIPWIDLATDEELVQALMSLEDPAARLTLYESLLVTELAYHHLVHNSALSPEKDGKHKQRLNNLREWTRNAPQDLRDMVLARAREHGSSN